MQVDTIKKEDNKCEVRVTIDAAEVDKETDNVAKLFQPQVQMKGFRKGAAPLDMVKNFYRIQILGEVSTRLLHHATSEALRTRDLRNVSNPELLEEYRPTEGRKHVGKFNLDGSFEFAVSVELPPEIDVTGYKEVEVEATSGDFDGWFKKKIHEQQVMYGEKDLVERPAKLGDELVIDFESFLDDQPIGGGKEEGYRLMLGEYSLLKDFEDAFIGKKTDEFFSTSVHFPDDYPKEEIAGKDCRFDCKVHEVNELTPHDLDEELAQILSYDDVDDMMKGYQEMFEEEFEAPLRLQIFNLIMEKVLERNVFEVPQVWIDREVETTKARLDAKDLDNNVQAMKTIREMSERTVKIAYLLDQIYAKENDIHLSAEDFKAIVDKEGEKVGMSGTELIERLKQTGAYEGLVTYHEQQKVMAFLVESAVLKEETVSDEP